MPRAVDVIVPVLNGGPRFVDCLSAIRAQRGASVQLIVVDNGSTDESVAVAGKFADLVVQTPERGSYRARNSGIFRSSADILAFIDADCVASPGWVMKGVDALARRNLDLCGGRVAHLPARTLSERFDEAVYLDQELYIRRWGFAATANLFVRRRVIDQIGVFDAALMSGGDVEFCIRATRAGYRLGYAPESVVTHEPRSSVRALIGKSWRHGAGHAQLEQRHPGVLPWPLSAKRLLPGTLTLRRHWCRPHIIALETMLNWVALVGHLNGRRSLTARATPVLWPHGSGGENPFLEVLYDALARQGCSIECRRLVQLIAADRTLRRRSIVHVNWVEHSVARTGFFRAIASGATFLCLMTCVRLRGAHVVWTLHNELSHERVHLLLEHTLRLAMGRLLAERVVTMHRQGVPGYIPKKKVRLVPHHTFGDYYGPPLKRVEARRHLDLEKDCVWFVFFGRLERYKGVTDLVESFGRLAGDNIRLLVAGRASEGAVEDDLRAACVLDARLRLKLQWIDEREVPAVVCASDWIVLPYRAVTNSSTADLALTYERPIVAPLLGGLRDRYVPGVYYSPHQLEHGLRDAASVTARERATLEAQCSEARGERSPEKVGQRMMSVLTELTG